MLCILCDSDDYNVDLVFEVKESTKTDLQQIIYKAKQLQEENDYNLSLIEYIKELLPNDCKIIDDYNILHY